MSADSTVARLSSGWKIVELFAGLIFAGLGIGLVAEGFDDASRVIGVAIIVLGLYVCLTGLCRGLIVRESGISLRNGLFSTRFIPRENIEGLEIVESRDFVVLICIPTLNLKAAQVDLDQDDQNREKASEVEKVPLQAIAFYRFRQGRETKKTRILRRFLTEF